MIGAALSLTSWAAVGARVRSPLPIPAQPSSPSIISGIETQKFHTRSPLPAALVRSMGGNVRQTFAVARRVALLQLVAGAN